MELLPNLGDRMKIGREKPVSNRFSYSQRKSPRYYSEETKFIETIDRAQDMLHFALQRPLSHIGFDIEYRYDKPGVVIDKENTVYDQHSIRPLLLSLAMIESSDEGEGSIYRFVIDLRKPELLPVLKELFALPLPFCGHFAKVDLFCLWQLGLLEPPILWDTFIFEKVLSLGRYHHKYKLKKNADEIEQIQARKETVEKKAYNNSLNATCQRYSVAYGMEGSKDKLRKSFLIHSEEGAFSGEQIDYAAENATVASLLYPRQVQKAVQHGLLRHCETVEMRWVTTNARIEWAGVRVDQVMRDQTINRISIQLEKLKNQLTDKYGISKLQSNNQLAAFFQDRGLLDLFRQGDKASFDKKTLKENSGKHPVVDLLRAARKASDLLADKLLSQEFLSDDGRVRADHQQLGTDTGRQTSRWPNLLGLNRMLRPLVIPEEGYGIGEVDWNQVEVGIAAAIFSDDGLIKIFNSGDIYSTMAQHFFRDELPAGDFEIADKEFKAKHTGLRNQMKSCTLGLLYGITPYGLAKQLETTKAAADALQKRFMAMFPQLQGALTMASQCGAIRGYAYSVSGLKRFRGKTGEANHWEKNWLTNHPVQGSAAVVFKTAGNRLDTLYQQYDARIIVPLHDSFVFEAPLTSLEKVTELTSRVMCDTLQEFFPLLRPQVEINISRPDCGNKDGKVDELEQWIDSMNKLMSKLEIGTNKKSSN
ncbi:MAG: hypothetical protein HQ517_04940 [SAR324 cluster bacterium]|nr:hypothetical protein [SAR324 cluster bacterium]